MRAAPFVAPPTTLAVSGVAYLNVFQVMYSATRGSEAATRNLRNAVCGVRVPPLYIRSYPLNTIAAGSGRTVRGTNRLQNPIAISDTTGIFPYPIAIAIGIP